MHLDSSVLPNSAVRHRGALSRVFGGGGDGLADAEGRLEQLIDPRIDRAAQAALVTDMSRADQAGMNYRRAAYNNIMGQIEAEQIGERMYRPYRPGAVTTAMVADESLGAIRSGTSQMPDAGRAGFSQIGPVAPVGVGELGVRQLTQVLVMHWEPFVLST